MKMKDWILSYTSWNPEEQPHREALCTLGNGIFATRGAAEEVPGNEYNYPGTYLSGGYNRLTSHVAGRDIENEDLVNWPNWLFLTFKQADGSWLDLDRVDVLEYVQELNLKNGNLKRKMKFRDDQNRVTSIISTRIVSIHNPHEAGIEWIMIPENWSGPAIIRSGIDGRVTNNGVERYRELEGTHLEIEEHGVEDDHTIYLSARTVQSEIKVSMAARTRIIYQERADNGERTPVDINHFAGEDITIHCDRLQPLRIEKLVTLYPSRDFAISDPLTEALSHVKGLDAIERIRGRNQDAWSEIWKKNDIEVDYSKKDAYQMVLRLHIFHLYQTVSTNSIGYDIGVPSRGWHGEAYRGHIFWDELYIFPFLTLHSPLLARSLLMYRCRRLQKAKEAAEEAGYRGSMFPWQSGSNGREESQVIHLNPESGRWIPDHTHLQVHINAAIPFNVWQYYQGTKDIEFLMIYGARIIMNTALFWSSISKLNPGRDRYEIRGIVGPDEYHTQYPWSDSPGLNNNAYTNFMAVWVMQRALEITEMVDEDTLKALQKRIGFDTGDMERWKEISSKMYIPFNSNGLILQFEGFDKLEELDWDRYRSEYGDTFRLDRILERENDSVNRYKASKQADVLMLFYLFSSEELQQVFNGMGYAFEPDQIVRNINYYQSISSHGSTLSRVVHSWVYARSDRNKSWDFLTRALMFDVEDEQGGTTSEGIHLGAMAGTVDLVLRGYSGLEIRDDVLWLNPSLPEEVSNIRFHLRYRSHWICLNIGHEKLKLEFDRGWAEPVEIGINGKKMLFESDESREFDL